MFFRLNIDLRDQFTVHASFYDLLFDIRACVQGSLMVIVFKFFLKTIVSPAVAEAVNSRLPLQQSETLSLVISIYAVRIMVYSDTHRSNCSITDQLITARSKH